MNIFDKLKSKSIDELVEWLDEYGYFDGVPWTKMFDKNYCKKCEPEIVYVPHFNREAECSWCELHDKCKFFQDMRGVPDNKHMIRMWLESEVELESEIEE